jgi:hypothetical protein
MDAAPAETGAFGKLEWRLTMKIKMNAMAWASGGERRAVRVLARHATGHYPKDAALHKAVLETLAAMEKAATRRARTAPKATKARRKVKRRVKRTARTAAPKATPARRRKPATTRRTKAKRAPTRRTRRATGARTMKRRAA